MLRWMFSVTRSDRIRDERIRGSLGITDIDGKMKEDKSRQFKRAERKNNNKKSEIRVQ